MSDTMARYTRAQDDFDALAATITAAEWDRPSLCDGWTVRDVIGHVVWGQRLTRDWAAGGEYPARGGAPGATHPGRDELAGAEPLATWREARDECLAALTPEALRRRIATGGFGEIPLEGFVTALVSDFLAHTFDIGHALGRDVRLAPELIPGAFDWARGTVLRKPGGIGPELTPPPGADEQTRFLAFLGRRAW